MSQSRGKIESLKCDGMRQDSAGFIIIILKSFLVIISGGEFTFVAFFGRNLDYFIKSSIIARGQQVALFGLSHCRLSDVSPLHSGQFCGENVFFLNFQAI